MCCFGIKTWFILSPAMSWVGLLSNRGWVILKVLLWTMGVDHSCSEIQHFGHCSVLTILFLGTFLFSHITNSQVETVAMLGSVRSKLVSNYQGYSTKSRAGLLLQGLSLEIGWSSWRFCTSGFNINGSDDAKSRHSKVQQNGRGGFCELAATSQKTSMFQCSSVDIAAMVTRQRRSSMAHARVLDKMGSAWSSFATFFRRGFEPRNLPLGWNEDHA